MGELNYLLLTIQLQISLFAVGYLLEPLTFY